MGAEKVQNSRLTYPDMAKGVGMILVIIAHSPYPSEGVRAFITAFHMPLFFIVSGMLMAHTGEEQKDFKSVALKKAKGIMIPYLTFSLLYMLITVAEMILTPERVAEHTLYKMFVDFITLHGISVLWFLTAVFFGELLFLGVRKLVRRTAHPDGLFVLTALLGAAVLIGGSSAFHTYYPLYRSMPLLLLGDFLMTLLRGVGVMCFLIVGYYLYRLYFGREGGGKARRAAEAAAGIACLAAVCVIAGQNGVVDFHFLYFFRPALYFAGAILGSVGVVLLCRQLPASRLLYFFGANSLLIMVTHLDCKVLITAIHYANWLNQYITRAKVYFLYLNVALMVFLLEALCVYIFRRWLPFMLGKPFRTRRKPGAGENGMNTKDRQL